MGKEGHSPAQHICTAAEAVQAGTSKHSSSFHLAEEKQNQGNDAQETGSTFAVWLKQGRCPNSANGFVCQGFRKSH